MWGTACFHPYALRQEAFAGCNCHRRLDKVDMHWMVQLIRSDWAWMAVHCLRVQAECLERDHSCKRDRNPCKCVLTFDNCGIPGELRHTIRSGLVSFCDAYSCCCASFSLDDLRCSLAAATRPLRARCRSLSEIANNSNTKLEYLDKRTLILLLRHVRHPDFVRRLISFLCRPPDICRTSMGA